MDNLEYLATYSTRTEAEIVKGLLEENGIKCFLQFNAQGNALEGGFGMINGPTIIYVSPEQLEKARQLAGVKQEE